MRLLKILLLLFVVLALAAILSKNAGQQVNVWLYPGQEYENVSFSTAMVITTAIGILLGFFVGLLQIMEYQSRIGQQTKQLKKLRTEINNLRHSGLEGDIFDESETDSGAKPELPAEDQPQQLEK
ncbi:MAG: LapA family protein [Candidatus Marinimicrobia bacterium]|nr:LapA family protein [Candidatus Neomarinimicrobiota bacterium]